MVIDFVFQWAEALKTHSIYVIALITMEIQPTQN